MDPDSFSSKKPWQRFLVLVAGVTMNVFLAVLLFSVGFMFGLPSIVDGPLPTSAHVSKSELSIMDVIPESPAQRAGIVSGDTLASVDGQVFADADAARSYLASHSTSGVDLSIIHEKNTRSVHLSAEPLKGTDAIGIGIAFTQTALISYPWYLAFVHGCLATWQMTVAILQSFWELLVGLIFTHQVSESLSGPVGIAVMTGQVAAMGFAYLLQFAAILSINLAVINILPFPALDGGRIFFLLIEKIRGRAVNEKLEIAVNNLGFLLLMALVVFVTVKDVMHLFN